MSVTETSKIGETHPAYLLDGDAGIGHPLDRPVVRIGRELGCGIVVRDPTVSRFHAEIRTERGGHVLYSRRSGGILLNGEPVASPRLLEPRDRIRIGDTSFTFLHGVMASAVRCGSPPVVGDDDLHRRPTFKAVPAIPPASRAPFGASHLLGGTFLAILLFAALLIALL